MAKWTVEQSLRLDLSCLRRGGPIDGGKGTVTWAWGTHQRSVDWAVCGDLMVLSFTGTKHDSPSTTRYQQVVSLVRTAQPRHIGGERIWFACPGCGRRARVLYQPGVGHPFACRRCHDLAYASQRQRSRKWRLWTRVNVLQRRMQVEHLRTPAWVRLVQKQRLLLAAIDALEASDPGHHRERKRLS